MQQRSFSISIDLFAFVWARRQPGEDSEDAILRRLLGLPREPEGSSKTQPKAGFIDERHGVSFEEGMEIFRLYKERRIRARAKDQKWIIPETGEAFSSLNLLSRAVTGSNENAWRSWYFLRNGKRVLIDELRQNHSSLKTAEELGL